MVVFIIDHQHHRSIALKIGVFDHVITRVEEEIVAVECEPDRSDVRPAVGPNHGQRGGARPLKQEGASFVRGHPVHLALRQLLARS